VVRPIIHVPHAAALIGHGSEILGFDDDMSTDHHWGPAVQIFLVDESPIGDINTRLSEKLPMIFKGYPARFRIAPDEAHVLLMTANPQEATHHRVSVTTLARYIQDVLGLNITGNIHSIDWLTFPSQKLLALNKGRVHYDGIGDLIHLRQKLAWYPRDVWVYLLACGWERIGQEEHLMGRAGYRGDEMGATIIANRLISDMMRLCFLMEKQYAPYAKWFGMAFNQLPIADGLNLIFRQIQLAPTWTERNIAYGQAIEIVMDLHNQLGITPPINSAPQPFFSRPFLVSCADEIISGLLMTITDPDVKRLLSLPTLLGNIDQFSDHTSLREATAWCERIKYLYTPNP